MTRLAVAKGTGLGPVSKWRRGRQRLTRYLIEHTGFKHTLIMKDTEWSYIRHYLTKWCSRVQLWDLISESSVDASNRPDIAAGRGGMTQCSWYHDLSDLAACCAACGRNEPPLTRF